MAKGKTATVFFCQNCGYESTKWLGQCPGCREWNTFVEETIDKTVLKNTGTGSRRERREASEPCVLSEIAIREENKTLTGIKELDRVLGGGIVQGSLTLVGGDPGIGKSTLLLQVCHNLSEAGHKVLYISGEESKVQIKMRADRLGTFSEHMLLLCETNLDIIGEVIRRSKPEVVIIDSIQTMYNENVSAAPGSVSQVRESTGILLQLAKGLGISIFIVGHVTKEGTVAGPRVLEHMVDMVLYFEGDRHASYRILRGVTHSAGMLLNQLHLIGLALFLHQLDGFLRLQFKPLQGLILLDNLLHLALNGGQIIGSQVPGQVKIVIKALINRRADGEHRIREQPAYRLGHNMGGRMPIGPFPFLGIKGQQLYLAVLCHRGSKVHHPAVELSRAGRLIQAAA